MRVSQSQADNVLTWDKEIVVAAMVVRVEIDLAKLISAVIHERAFMTSTTYPFPYLIFNCAGMQECKFCNGIRLLYPTGKVDIGIIRDEVNAAAPHRVPRIKVHTLSENLVDTVQLAEWVDYPAQKHNDPTSASSSHAASTVPYSSRSTPTYAILIPLDRV